jgi:hypothetical protein
VWFRETRGNELTLEAGDETLPHWRFRVSFTV